MNSCGVPWVREIASSFAGLGAAAVNANGIITSTTMLVIDAEVVGVALSVAFIVPLASQFVFGVRAVIKMVFAVWSIVAVTQLSLSEVNS